MSFERGNAARLQEHCKELSLLRREKDEAVSRLLLDLNSQRNDNARLAQLVDSLRAELVQSRKENEKVVGGCLLFSKQ